MLALAYEKGLCCSFGMYDENIEIILRKYIYANSQIDMEFKKMNENIDLLIDTVDKVNRNIEASLKKYIVLLDDTYCEGCFYIFQITVDEYLEKWESTQIERLL